MEKYNQVELNIDSTGGNEIKLEDIEIKVEPRDNQYQCNYRDNCNLIRQQRTYSGKKPFKCDEWDKSIAHRNILVTQVTAQSGEKTFKYMCQLLPANDSAR